MKLQSKTINRDGEGSVVLVPEEPEDMWHAYNLIAVGDAVRTNTIRKIRKETDNGKALIERVHTTLTIAVETIDYDALLGKLRLKGRNIEENEYVRLLAYHTLELEVNKKFQLRKAEWDTVSMERVYLACDPTKSADVAAVIMQEGIAHVCLITSHMTLVRAKIENHIPKKRKGFVAQYEKGIQKFYDNVLQSILRHVDFNIVKCVLICSPGFVREQFYEFINQTATKTDHKVLLENKGKFLLVHASSGFKHSLKEVLQDPIVLGKISDTKAAGEVKALESFYTMLQLEPSKAFYGLKHIQKATEAEAIDTLLISDKLFRCEDAELRKEYVKLVDAIREVGGEVKIFSSLHISGEQLDQVTGIAAILRFPMPELEEDDTDDDDDGKDDQ